MSIVVRRLKVTAQFPIPVPNILIVGGHGGELSHGLKVFSRFQERFKTIFITALQVINQFMKLGDFQQI